MSTSAAARPRVKAKDLVVRPNPRLTGSYTITLDAAQVGFILITHRNLKVTALINDYGTRLEVTVLTGACDGANEFNKEEFDFWAKLACKRIAKEINRHWKAKEREHVYVTRPSE